LRHIKAVQRLQLFRAPALPGSGETTSADIDRQKGVRNDLEQILTTVKPSAQLFEVKPKIEEALKRHAVLEAAHISVSANGSAVTLSGHVKTWLERELAEQAALSVSGVAVLTNRLRVEA
jgi:osmotically-inducible protein OsmY